MTYKPVGVDSVTGRFSARIELALAKRHNPLNLKLAFGCLGDGSNETAKILNAISAQQNFGGGAIVAPAGEYGFDAELDFSLGIIGDGIGQYGGSGNTQKRTIFKRLGANGVIRIGPGPNQQFGGSFGVFNGGGPVRDFTIDGGDIVSTKELFVVGVVGARVIDSIRVDNIGQGAYGMLIWGAQNCVFRKISVVNGRSGGICIDYGAGGNTFDTINTSRVQMNNEGCALLMTESQRTGGTGVYSNGPSQNMFYDCGFERVQDATGGLVRLLSGRDNTFDNCWLAAGSELTQANDLVYIGTDVTGGAVNTRFNSCRFTGGVEGQDKITGVHMAIGIGAVSFYGQNTFRQMLIGVRNEGTAGYYGAMKPIYTSVTTELSIGAGKGPVFIPMNHLSSGAGFRMEQWVASAAGDYDGYYDVLGPSGVGSHRVFTVPATVTTPPSGGGSAAMPTLRSDPTTDGPTVNSTRVFVTDTGFAIPGLVAGGIYEWESVVIYDADAAAKILFKFQYPTGSTGWWAPNSLVNTASNTTSSINRSVGYDLSAGYGGVSAATAGINVPVFANPRGKFTAGAAGSFTFQYAQNVDTVAGALIRRAGSSIKLTRIA